MREDVRHRDRKIKARTEKMPHPSAKALLLVGRSSNLKLKRSGPGRWFAFRISEIHDDLYHLAVCQARDDSRSRRCVLSHGVLDPSIRTSFARVGAASCSGSDAYRD